MKVETVKCKFSYVFSIKVSARKKKNGKHSGMMMFGGMAMVGMIAQLILGKITALAAAALILAKIALVFSTLVRKCTVHSDK